MEFTQTDARLLAATLDELDLPDGQRHALHALFEAASRDQDDVSGFVELSVPDVLPLRSKPNFGTPKSLLDYDWIAAVGRKPGE